MRSERGSGANGRPPAHALRSTGAIAVTLRAGSPRSAHRAAGLIDPRKRHKTPSWLNRRVAATRTIQVELPSAADLEASFEPLRRWDDDLLDRWDGRSLLRTVPGPDGPIPVALARAGSRTLDVTLPSGAPVEPVAQAAGALLITAEPQLAALARADPAVRALVERVPAVRPVRYFDRFALLVRSISSQQVNLRWATTTRRRLVEALGTRHRLGDLEVWSLPAQRLAGADPADLRAMQFTWRKAEYLVGLGQAIVAGELDLAALDALDDDAATAALTARRGLGRWTAEWLLVRGLGRAHVVAGDLGVRKAVGALYGEPDLPAEARVRELTSHWGEAAAVAQQLALEDLYGR